MAVNQDDRERPAVSIKKAIAIFKERGGKRIVEIGSMRGALPHPLEQTHHWCCNDGHSSVHWAAAAESFWTVDISPSSSACARTALQQHNLLKHSHVITGDGIEFFNKTYDKAPIDLLYLDAWDVDLPDCTQKHLECYNIAKQFLHPKSLVLIDDTDVVQRGRELFFSETGVEGKGELIIPAAISDGFHIVYSGRQTLLSKKV